MRWKFKNSVTVIAKLAAAGMLFGALARHSYDYYTLLRWLVCGVSVFAAVGLAETDRTAWVWTFAIVALFFNPLIPVRLKRDTWVFIDLAVAALFVISIPFTDQLRLPP